MCIKSCRANVNSKILLALDKLDSQHALHFARDLMCRVKMSLFYMFYSKTRKGGYLILFNFLGVLIEVLIQVIDIIYNIILYVILL